ncbi:MAG: sigma-70 family RNA polymerase sigma factor [Gemmatimonadota bacterium]
MAMRAPAGSGAGAGAPKGAPAQVPDAWLVERVRAGDAEAYGELVRRHMRRAFSIAYRILEHREDAEDVVQEAFVRALERFDTLERGRPFEPWIYRIVVNGALNYRRARSIRRAEPIPEDTRSGDTAPDGAAERSELRRRLRDAMAGLPERQRTIVQLAELEGFTSAEIAEILGLSDGTVRWHLLQARRALREALAPLMEEDR